MGAEEPRSLSVVEAHPAPVVITRDAFMFEAQTTYLWKLATRYAGSRIVPEVYRNPEAAFVACQLAARLGVDPMMVMQNVHMVKERPTLGAAFANSLAFNSGVFTGRIRFRYEGEGENLVVTAYATRADDGELCEGVVSMKMAREENWVKNEKYRSMPRQMLSYRAIMFLLRLHAPDVILGMHAREELEDEIGLVSRPARVVNMISEKPLPSSPGATAEDLNAVIGLSPA